MGEHSSSLVTPIPASIFTNAGKSLSIERSGQTWLPMGSPRGLAARLAALATSKPAAPEQIVTLSVNSRRDIVLISIFPFLVYSSQPGRYSRVSSLLASGMFVIFALAESQRTLRPPSLNEMEAKFTESQIGPASRKSP